MQSGGVALCVYSVLRALNWVSGWSQERGSG